MDVAWNFSDLRALLNNTLLITEEAIEVLKKNCDEATFALKPWKMESITIEQKDESVCNCKKITTENEVENISTDINKTLVLAQELREKIQHNIALQKRRLRKNPVEVIYQSAHTSNSNKKKELKKHVATNISEKNVEKTLTRLQKDKVNPVISGKSTINSASNIKRTNATNKIQSKTSIAIVAAKSKKERNFVLENKLHVKAISSKQTNKLKIGNNVPNDIPGSSKIKDSTISTELSNLIHKMTQLSTQSILTPHSENDKSNCPLHRDNKNQSIYEHKKYIDVVEALQQFNVPNEIVKVLRLYHVFLKTEQTNNLKDTKTEKYRKSVDIFLKEFNIMNTTTQNHLLKEPHLINITTESISLFGITVSENCLMQLNNIKKTCRELGATLKQYDDNIEPIIEMPFCKLSFVKGWLSNGIWNISCTEHFKNLTKTYSIRYHNTKQLLMLYEAIQKLQHTKYLDTLIQIILHNIIPVIKSNFDPTSTEYAQVYKMIFILYQGLNPEVPVLVRTDN